MGLKTTNYEVKKSKQTLPNAYAILDGLSKIKNSVLVTFGIYASRDDVDKSQPIETKQLHFRWDRKKNLAEQAYETATQKGGIFEGWTDDIVEV